MFKRATLIGATVMLLVLGMLFSFSLVGIQAQDATAVPTATPIVAELGSGGLQITFWNGLTGSDGVTLNSMLAQFVEENPDISIRTEIVDWNTLYTKLQTAFVAGQPPDVFLLHASEILQFQSLGLLMPLDSWYDTAGGTIPASDFAQPGFDGVFVDGVPYGVPLDNHGRGVWENNGLLEAAGFDPSADLPVGQDLISMLQALTLDANGNNAASADFDPTNVVQWGTSMEWVYTDYESYLSQFGGQIISDDGLTATVNSEASIAALQAMYDLIYTYHVSPPPAGFDSWQSWAGGRVAIVPTGTWFRNFAVDQTDIQWTAHPAFQFGPQPGTWFGAHTFMIPSTAEGERLAAARRMIEWVTVHEQDWAASGQVPARVSIQQALDPELYTSNITIGQTFQEYGQMEVRSSAILELQSALNPQLNAALNGQVSVEQALSDANDRMQAILDRTQGG